MDNKMRLLTLLFVAFTFSTTAQTATNFNIDDVDGTNCDLFTELDVGNIVVLKFFTMWCGICNNTADDVIAIYNSYQSNGDPVVFWALDRDQTETNADAIGYRNTHSIPFPVIGEAYSIAQQFGVLYQPEYYIVRPDRSYVKRTNYTTMQTAVNEALASITTAIEKGFEQSSILVAGSKIFWNAESSETAKVVVVNARGRIVLDKTINGQKSVLINQPAGIYIYTFEQDGKTIASGKLGLTKLSYE
jgi:thiol-disulfide isomerase/thioredoxin